VYPIIKIGLVIFGKKEKTGGRRGMLESSFFTKFLQLSDFRTLAFIVVLVALFKVINVLQKKKVSFSTRMITGTVIGLILGVAVQAVANFPDAPKDVAWINELSGWYSLVGGGFIDLLKMLVVPLIFLSIIRVIMNMQGENLGKMTSKTIGMLIGTTAIAALIGIVLAILFNLGQGFDAGNNTAEIREAVSLAETIRGLLPSNIVSSMAEGNIVGIVIFSAFIGTSIRRLSKKHADTIEPFVKWVEASYKIIISVTMTIIKFMPYAVIALLANTIISNGVGVLASVGKFIVCIYLAIAIMLVVHMTIAVLNGISPITYIKNASEPLVLAFTSRSSLGTLPVTVETLQQKFDVNEGVASFVASLGSNMGMNGCAGIYPALMTIMLAQITKTPIDISFCIMLLVVIAISSFGIAGLPGTATLAISVVISGMGMEAYFPLLGAIIAIDPIIDMGRTMLNVSGTIVSAVTVDKSLKRDAAKADKDVKKVG
ncbi:cation:dicarboxylase symporter family transporter, partial [Intestinibacter bartlettii]|uniref:cation:dicarboxylate symporter family transporter n=1 Tax=Intestinibacter bartlettii TaxID=261299 RepID=UPI002ED482D8